MSRVAKPPDSHDPVRVRNCYATVFVLLCVAQLLVQAQTASAHSRPAEAAVSAPAEDWREALSKDSGAPIKVVEFFDYQCPFCNATVPALEAALKNHSGQVQLILKHDPLPSHPDSLLAHEAALAAGEQGRFWEMHDLLFAHQRRLKPQDLRELARQIHLDLPRFEERLRSEYYKPAIERDMALAKALGVDGTPTFFINGQKLSGTQTMQGLESAFAGQAASNKGPAASNLDLSHSPFRGPAEAPITIVEFSDFECPFCARAVPGLQELLRQYPTEIKWVFKNYPLSFHADSSLAHRAALAAGEQGKFWEMHDLVFADQKFLKRNSLIEKARRLHLDMAKFISDLESNKIKHQIETDQEEGNALHVNGTPTFFINGREYAGVLTLDTLKSVVDRELAAVGNNPIRAMAQTQSEIAFGPSDAPVTLVWFSDLQSKLSLQATLVIRQIMDMHPGKIRLIFKNRPLESHLNSGMLHEAALAAHAQGKFWPMHDLIVASPAKISKQDLLAYAQRIGLDVKRFESELDSHKYNPRIQRDLGEARQRGVQGTPVFFLNATRIDGLQPLKAFDALVSAQLRPQMQASSR